jgi:hypothetical protein
MVPFVLSFFGFVGAWLLFLGPVYQASLELRAHRYAMEKMKSLDDLAPPPRLSSWWWVLFPVKLLLERRQVAAYREACIEALTVDDLAALLALRNAATGWICVAAGGLLLAVKETSQCCGVLHLGLAVFVAVALGMAAGCALATAVPLWLTDRALARKKRGEIPVDTAL